MGNSGHTQLTYEQIKCLSDSTRFKILGILEKKPSYAAEIAKELDIQKQKVYYHIDKLYEADLIEENKKEKHSGGTATYYQIKQNEYLFQIKKSDKQVYNATNEKVKRFLNPFIQEKKINGKIVVGSPDEHGPDQVRARDGHLAAEISQMMGKYGEGNQRLTYLDTEIRAEGNEDNLILLGGILTNIVTKNFNDSLNIKFSDKEFPYRQLETKDNNYSKPSIGVISKSKNPNNEDNYVYVVAGVRNKGTQAATLAFKQLEDILENYKEGEYYIVVNGLDISGDGKIDDYEVLEKKQ